MTASCTVGSNGSPDCRRHLGEPVRGQRVVQLPGDQLQAGDQLALLVPRRGLEGAAHVVHDRQQRLDDVLGGAQAQLVALAPDALAVVLELGLEAPEVVEVVVALGGEARRLARSARRSGRRPRRPRGGLARASCGVRPRRLVRRRGGVCGSSCLCFLSVMSSCPSCGRWLTGGGAGIPAPPPGGSLCARRSALGIRPLGVDGLLGLDLDTLAASPPRPSARVTVRMPSS